MILVFWLHHSLFVCLDFSSHSRIFNLFGDVTIAGEGLQILTHAYAWHSWPLSSEGSLACHNFCDTGHPFIMVISEDPWHSIDRPNAEHLAVELSLPVYMTWVCHGCDKQTIFFNLPWDQFDFHWVRCKIKIINVSFISRIYFLSISHQHILYKAEKN